MSYLNFLGNLFGYRPEQNVEPSEWEGLKNDVAVAIKNGTMSKEQAQEAMGTFRSVIGEKAKKFVEMVEATIKLTPSDRIKTKSKGKNEPEVITSEIPEERVRVKKQKTDRFIDDK